MTEPFQHLADVLHMVNTLIPNSETAFVVCYLLPFIVIGAWSAIRIYFSSVPLSADRDEKRKNDEVNYQYVFVNGRTRIISPLPEKTPEPGTSQYGAFASWQQPIDDEVFDEKRKRLEEDDKQDESYWTVGDDGELVEEKRKR